VEALRDRPAEYELQGTGRGKAVVIKDNAGGVLRTIKEGVLEAYEKKIFAAGGIDLHVVGVGGRGHVAFHESGIPFQGNRVLLVKLDDNTVDNAVHDGHFSCREESPLYAISMGAELVYQAGTVVLLANGSRKTGPVAESILGDISCDVPISYGRNLVQRGGTLIYVLDEAAAIDVLARRAEVEARGCEIIDMRHLPYPRVADVVFARDPDSGRLR